MKINFIKPKAVRQGLWKTLNAVVAVVTILNVSLVGAFIAPQAAQAAAANPSANLDQCANDPAPSPSTDGCSASASDWVNGNLEASKSVYYEGDSVPYRMLFGSLSLATHTVIIEWDTTKSDKHALDYITTYNQTVATANPTLGVSGPPAPTTTFPIPADPQVTGAGVTPIAGNLTLFGGTITGVSAYSYADGTGFSGNKSARISVTFTASVANPVLAWGGHISARADWGADNSAVAIPGSPYHTRLIDLDGSGGNQDRSLSAEAVIFPGSITVVKDATPNGPQSFGYTTTGGLTPSTFSLVDNGTSANTKVYSDITSFTGDKISKTTTQPSYTVTESALAGWTLNGIECTVTTANGGTQSVSGPTATIDLKEGENVTCTYANTRQAATLIVIKHVINDNGGTAVASDFTLDAGGTGDTPDNFPGAEAPGTSVTLDAGAYDVTETGPAGYAASYSTDCSGTIAYGQTKTCTVTNNDVQPKLTVTKVVINNNGGTAVVSDFPLFVNATGVTSGVQNGFNAGAYVVSETNQPGYTATISGDCDAQGNVTLAVGDVKACTITNDDQAASLTVIKHVINDNGGNNPASSFTMHVTGGSVSPSSFSGNEGGTGVSLDAGSYAVTEDSVAGYTASYSADCSGTLAPGQHKTCTVTNNDVAPSITLTKIVTNDNGGTAGPNDFGLTIGGTPVTSGQTLPLDANTPYALNEAGLTGYAFASLTGDAKCPSVLGGTLTLNEGEHVTCTITNNDIAPQLTVTKVVINDNGGNNVAADFPLKVDQTSVTSGVAHGFNAGTYVVSETPLSGYTQISISGDCDAQGNVTLAVGDVKACTITNDDVAPTITLIKEVINDHGGTAGPNDFGLSLGGDPVASGQTVTVDANTPYTVDELGLPGYSFVSLTGSPECPQALDGTITADEGEQLTCTITNDDVQPTLTLIKVVVNDNGGQAQVSNFPLYITDGETVLPTTSGTTNPLTANVPYTVYEDNLPGYTPGTWVGDCTPDGSVTLVPGDQAVCTITNDDQVATLTVIKHVVNDNGGNALAGQFTMQVSGDNVSDSSFPGDESGTTVTLDAGSYFVSELGLVGYTGSYSDDCDGTISNGEHKTCVITNNDVAPTITLVKVVDNKGYEQKGRDLGPNGFGLSIGGTSVTSGQTLPVDANTPYALNEVVPVGYYQFVSLTGDAKCPSVLNGTVTLNEGEDITCTIANEAILPTVEIQKESTPADTVAAGATVTWTINWSVTGAVATDVVLTDSMPNDSTFVSGTCGNSTNCTFTPPGTPTGTATWNLGTRQPGDSGFVTLVTLTGTPLTNGTLITNTALIDALEIDPAIAATDTVHVVSAPVLTIVKTDSPDPVEAGANLTYALAWTVTGNAPATNVTITDPLPPNTTFVSADCGTTSGTCVITSPAVGSTSTVTWDLGTRIPSASGSVSLVVKVASPLSNGTILTNTGTICGLNEPAPQAELDSQRLCDDDTTTTTVHALPVLGLSKTGTPNPIDAGQAINWTVHWSVAGNALATNLAITDPVPANTTFVSVADSGIYDATTNTLSWFLGTQAPGSSGDVHFVTRAASPILDGTVVTNIATIDSTETNPVVATASVIVHSAPLLSITKTNSVATFTNPGQPVTYTVVITNAAGATDTARNVVLTDTLPTGFTFAVDGTTTKSFTIGDLKPGQSATVTYLVNVSGTQPAGTYVNQAKAKGDNTNQVTATSSVEVRVPQVLSFTTPDLTITKTVNHRTAKPGDVVTYELTIKNVGDGDATNVVVTDTLPKDLSFVHGTGRTVTWELGTLQSGRSRVLHVDVRVESDAQSGDYTNVATVAANDLPEQQAQATLTVKRPKVLGLATTGTGPLDYLIGTLGLALIALGVLGLKRRTNGGVNDGLNSAVTPGRGIW